MAASTNDDVLLEMKKRLKDDENFFDALKRFQSIRDKLKFILESENLRIRIPNEESSLKSLENSVKYRNDGNEYFKINKSNLAAKKYTMSIFCCPLSEQYDLSINYANRSAALFDLGLFKESLDDISRSLENNYPEHLRYKIYLRRAKCQHYLNQPDLALKSLKIALEYIEKAKLSHTSRNKIKSEISLLQKRIASENSQTAFEETVNDEPELFKEVNKKVSNASSAIDVRFAKGRGRFIEAKEDIPIGSVLFVEKAYASLLLPDRYLSHCFHCCRKNSALIPCLHCSDIGYCCISCRDECWSKFHMYECQRLHHLNQIGVMHLAMRVLLAAGIEDAIKLENNIKRWKNESWFKVNHLGVNRDGIYDGSYYSVYYLETHEDDVPSDQILNHILSSCHVTWFLSDKTTSQNAEPSNWITYLIYRHSLQIICNAHAITEMREKSQHQEESDERCRVENKNDVYDFEQRRIAVAIYPTVSLMNHSCKPNVIASFDGDVVVLRTSDLVTSRREIVNCYGPHYLRMSRTRRLKVLKEQYKFQCVCQCCVKNEDGLFVSDELDKLAKYHAMKGDFKEALSCLMKSVEEVRRFYGDGSVELGYELLKLTDVMVKTISERDVGELQTEAFRKSVRELIETCREGIKIFATLFGISNEHVVDFQQKINVFEPFLECK